MISKRSGCRAGSRHPTPSPREETRSNRLDSHRTAHPESPPYPPSRGTGDLPRALEGSCRACPCAGVQAVTAPHSVRRAEGVSPGADVPTASPSLSPRTRGTLGGERTLSVPGYARTRAGVSHGATAPLQAGGAGGLGPPAEAGTPLASAGSPWGAVGASAEPDREQALAPAPPQRAHSPLNRRPVAPRGPASRAANSMACSAAPGCMARLGCALGHRGATAVERTDP